MRIGVWGSVPFGSVTLTKGRTTELAGPVLSGAGTESGHPEPALCTRDLRLASGQGLTVALVTYRAWQNGSGFSHLEDP